MINKHACGNDDLATISYSPPEYGLKRRNSLDLDKNLGSSFLRISKSYGSIGLSEIDIKNLVEEASFDNTDIQSKKEPRNLRRKMKLTVKPWAELPEDILLIIFEFAGIKSMIKLARVCTSWYSLSNDKDLWSYIAPRRAWIERKRFHQILVNHGVTNLKNEVQELPEKWNFLSDLLLLPLHKRSLASCCLKGKKRYYDIRYQLSSEQLISANAFKKTLLPLSTLSKTKFVIIIPEGCFKEIYYSVTIQGVEISGGRMPISTLLEKIEKNGDINLDPIVFHALPLLVVLFGL